ncbi:MAG: BMP family ABC transporter substrate-binding protein [Alphaproteobacteria bacterium]|jgi:basic membrane protein A and related proteins|nr:BMP family ABC transporter substrate-binding protein [Alphaproteobacteria bacterium]MBT4084244.1 BMP family ABC transporter substrate-binding protein [Alphaproteobacteria bacterium]MBT7748197.1 BMP family ABC transporter substrate-binding protein [Alphaproteobacteria bacterium]
MSLTRRSFSLLTAAGLGLGVALGAMSATAADKLKVGFVYVGPIGDHGWSYQHDQGRLAVEKHFGDKVETTYVESVPEGADAERVIRSLAQKGHDLIFTTSFGYMNPTIKVAKQFPKVKFEHATGYKRSKNVATYLSRTYEGRYISGYLAAKMSKTGTVGYIASFPIPEVIRDINSVMLGMQSVRPDMKMKIIWVNSWFDPGKEAAAAKVMIGQGVDVILQHTDSPAAMQVAQKEKIWAVGQASDMRAFGPDAHLTSVIDDWAPYYIKRVQSLMDGTWTASDHWGGMPEGDIVIGPIHANVPADIKAGAEKLIAGLKAKSFHPFTGPIANQAGKVIVPAGKTMTDGELAGMNWYVKGVEGSIPK